MAHESRRKRHIERGHISVAPVPSLPEPDQDPETDEVLRVVRGFSPKLVSSSRYSKVEDLIRDAVADCHPSSPGRARDMIRYGTYLAAWCDHQGLTLRRNTVFDPEIVEEFIWDLRGHMAEESAGTVASVLRTMSELIGPPVEERIRREVHRGRRLRPPYDESEVTQLFDTAAKARSAKRRHDLTALLVLGLSAGATGQEAANAMPEDVTVERGAVSVILRRRRRDQTWRERTVTVLPHFESLLIELVNGSAQYLVGGGRARHSRVYDLCDQSRAGRWPVKLEPARLRATYLAEIASQPNTVLELLDRAGLETFEVFHELLPHLRAGQASKD